MIPFMGFTPDIDPTTQGAIVDCENIIPTLRGMGGAPTPYDVGLPALAEESRGASSLSRLDGQRRMFVGSESEIYEVGATSFTDVSKAGGYTGGLESKWRFAQFGNASLASNYADVIQVSTSGDFADIADAPQAKIIDTASGFVLAFNITSALVGDLPHGWACSGLYDHLTWTPATSNLAAWGMLMDTPGEIRAGKRLGQDVVAYKERSMYLGRFVGAPVIWQWQLIASDIGAISQECVIDTGTTHVFLGRDDFWQFDGSRPVAIGAPVKEWFFSRMDQQYAHRVQGGLDRFNKCAWWWFPTKDSAGVLSEAIIFNTATNKWGRTTVTAECVFDYQTPDLTWDDWPPGTPATYEDIPDIPYDSPAWDTSAPQFAIIGSDSKIKVMSGACASAYIVTGEFGDDSQYSTLTSVVPRFTDRPTTSYMTHYVAEYSGGAMTQASESALNGNKFDALYSGRWHRIKLEFTGNFEITAYQPNLTQDGTQ